jgi:hypothetical protein
MIIYQKTGFSPTPALRIRTTSTNWYRIKAENDLDQDRARGMHCGCAEPDDLAWYGGALAWHWR